MIITIWPWITIESDCTHSEHMEQAMSSLKWITMAVTGITEPIMVQDPEIS